MTHDAPRRENDPDASQDAATYTDAHVRLGTDALHIATRTGRWRRIPYQEIRSVTSFPLGALTGRYRLVGLGFARPRNWFHWDTSRRHKTTAIALNTGRWLRPTITPERPQAVLNILNRRLAAARSAAPITPTK